MWVKWSHAPGVELLWRELWLSSATSSADRLVGGYGFGDDLLLRCWYLAKRVGGRARGLTVGFIMRGRRLLCKVFQQ